MENRRHHKRNLLLKSEQPYVGIKWEDTGNYKKHILSLHSGKQPRLKEDLSSYTTYKPVRDK